MTKPLILLSLVAALTAGPAFAQQQEPTGESNIGGGLDLGEDIADGAGDAPGNPPQTYIKATYEDWQLQCLPVQEAQEVCQMYQLLSDGNGSNVAEVSLFKLENGGQAVAGGTFIVPLETLLTQKLTIAVDGGQPRRYDFAFCAPVGCYARVGFTQEDIDRFRAGAVAQVSIVPALAPDQTVTVDMSLSGFTAAYGEVSSLTQ